MEKGYNGSEADSSPPFREGSSRLIDKLLATGDAVIHEDSKTDMFWGKKGKDMLGKLLMRVRDEIRGGEGG